MTNFDPVGYKRSTRDQWQAAAAAWRRWQPVIDGWLREGTDLMLDLAQVQAGGRVLDVAAGAAGRASPQRDAWGPRARCSRRTSPRTSCGTWNGTRRPPG
jgi:hypothetical protein